MMDEDDHDDDNDVDHDNDVYRDNYHVDDVDECDDDDDDENATRWRAGSALPLRDLYFF